MPETTESKLTRAPQVVVEALRLLHTLMQGKSLTATEAATRHAFQPPAVRRHLQALSEQLRGLVVAEKDGKSQRYRFVWPRQEQSDGATVLALELARTALVSLRGSNLDARLADLVLDHQRRTPGALTLDLARVLHARTRVDRALGSRGMDADAVDQIVRGIIDRRQLTFEYSHFGGKHARVVLEPWTLVPSDEGLFCYGKCVDSSVESHLDTRRLYKVARMQRVRRGAETFMYPPADVYQPSEVFRHCFGVFLPDEGTEPQNVVLRLGPRWHAFLTHEPLHPSQGELIHLPDGQIQVEMRVYLTLDLERWLRGLGQEVQVVAPQVLRERVASKGELHVG